MYEMANLHFYLEKRKNNNGGALNRECPVLLSFSYSSIRVKAYTGRKVREQEWDKTRERAAVTHAHADIINSFLEQLEDRIISSFREMESEGVLPEPAKFHKIIKKMMKCEAPSLTGLLLRFIGENNKSWSISTYKKIKTFYTQMKEYTNKWEVIVTPGMVNQDFADNLVRFYREKGLQDSSIKKNLELLKWLMNWCLHNDLIINRDYQDIRFKPHTTAAYNDVYLSWNDLVQFYSFNDLTKREEWCRDIFCFICFTGLRFSKLDKLLKTHLNGRQILISEGPDSSIMLNRFAFEICRKYENRYYRKNTLFPDMSIITFNKHLKSAALKSGLNSRVYTTTSTFFSKPVHKLISAKIAINTFYAHLAKMGGYPDLTRVKRVNSPKTRILSASGAFNLAEQKQISETDQLFVSIMSPA